MNPPIADPTSTPIRSRSNPDRSASSTASRAAVIASRTLRSSRRASLGDATTDGSKSGTSPTTVIGRSPGSKCVGSPMPDRPSRIAFQATSVPIPTGDTIPIPVMAMRT